LVLGGVVEGKDAFGSVGVCDEACRLNGSRYESTIGSLCGWHDHSPPPRSVGKNLTRWWFEFKERLHVLGLSLATGQIIGPHATLTVRFVVQLLWLMLHQNNDIRGEELNTCHIFDVQCSFSSITK
jgi:hypothetical protein